MLVMDGTIFASNVDDPYRINTHRIMYVAPDLAKTLAVFIVINELEKSRLSGSILQTPRKIQYPWINRGSTVGVHKVSLILSNLEPS